VRAFNLVNAVLERDPIQLFDLQVWWNVERAGTGPDPLLIWGGKHEHFLSTRYVEGVAADTLLGRARRPARDPTGRSGAGRDQQPGGDDPTG
jgi:hypothetical protein